jgi:hypothetical protein
MATSLSAKLAKNINYLAITPMEQLYDDGVEFDGEDKKTQNLNHDDFNAARAIYTQQFAALSEDGRMFLLRSLRCMIRAECFQ